MSIKKVFSAFLSIILFSSGLFAESSKNISYNKSKVWSVDSDVYEYLCALYSLEKCAFPSNAGPWSTDELCRMLDNFEGKELNEKSQQLYDKIEGILKEKSRFVTSDKLHFNIGGTFNPEFYIHSNKTDFNKESDWLYDYESREDLLTFNSEMWIANHGYALMDIGLGYAANIYDQYNDSVEDILFSPVFMSNIPFAGNSNLGAVSSNFPKKAFIALGGDRWSLSFGRDVIRWGNGESGNLFLGGNSLYDTNLRFATYYDTFKYTFLTNFYFHDQMLNCYGQNDLIEGFKIFMAHRFDFRFIHDRFAVSIAEAIMYQSTDGFPDLKFWNPLMIYHSYYIRGNANSLLCVDANFTAAEGLNFYGQFVLDEMAVLGEPTTETEKGGRPGKLGGLFGIKYYLPVFDGSLKLCAEGVYADTYLYLREKYDETTGRNGVSFYSNTREFSSLGYGGKEIYYVRNCIGYKYGGDCITGTLKASFDSLDKWKSGAEFFYMAHGIAYNDLSDDWLKNQKTPHTPSTVNTLATDGKTSGSVEHLFRFSISGSYDFFDWLKIYGGTDNWFIINKNNQNKAAVYDFQLHSGVKLTF